MGNPVICEGWGATETSQLVLVGRMSATGYWLPVTEETAIPDAYLIILFIETGGEGGSRLRGYLLLLCFVDPFLQLS